jgi:hypothetical protein
MLVPWDLSRLNTLLLLELLYNTSLTGERTIITWSQLPVTYSASGIVRSGSLICPDRLNPSSFLKSSQVIKSQIKSKSNVHYTKSNQFKFKSNSNQVSNQIQIRFQIKFKSNSNQVSNEYLNVTVVKLDACRCPISLSSQRHMDTTLYIK